MHAYAKTLMSNIPLLIPGEVPLVRWGWRERSLSFYFINFMDCMKVYF
jgi:hypothetical protein